MSNRKDFPTIIGLTGAARSGKDTAAEHLVETMGFERIAFADALRDMVMAGFGLLPEDMQGDKKEEEIDWLGASPRRILQTLGTEWGRAHLGPDLWVKLAWRRMAEMHECGQRLFVFTDVRFDNEAQAIVNSGGTLLRLVRPGAPGVRAHASEAGVDDSYVSAVVVNDSTIANLHNRVRMHARLAEKEAMGW